MEMYNIVVLIVLFVAGCGLIYYVLKNVGNKKVVNAVIPDIDTIREVLHAKVDFFNKLKQGQQEDFIQRVSYFLHTTKISPEKGAVITDEHRILIAASATIPLFHFNTWSYENLDEVLVYPGTFDERYGTEDADRNILGMVGDGAMHRKMIISLQALMGGFSQHANSNTAIHEFVHLIDKADGDVDGVPEYLIPKELIKPWIDEMHATISAIRRDRSDIRDYAATNPAEFLAVVSEYFFQKPQMLKSDHPELYELLDEIYAGKKTIKEPI
ncbi:zinc-dependent peptidase [Sphingobacterium lactis]|uniref:M90 family metallopeptidase n=1 Tax=Sphingobacterium lactis TaxID=797291 RepID=UPI003EC666A3